MTFQEACQQVISEKVPNSDYESQYGIWRESWPQDTILGFNEKKEAFANFPGVSIFLDSIVSKCVVFSLTKTDQVNYIGWLPSVEDLTSTDWDNNATRAQPQE